MSDPLIYDCNNYVVMEPEKKEEFMNAEETLEWLEQWLNQLEKLPQDLENQPSLKAAATRLLDTACNLEIKPGFAIQWYAVRLDPPSN